jgi:hypothetical protein
MHVCMMCVYIYIYTHTHVYTHKHKLVCMYVRIMDCDDVPDLSRKNLDERRCVCMYGYIYMFMYVCVRMYL